MARQPRTSGDARIDVPLKGRTFERTQGCWNCVAGESLVLTPHGGVPIEKACDVSAVENEHGMTFSTAWIPSGRKPVVEVRTTYGIRVRVTPDHRVFTERGWIAACDLVPGEEVATMQEAVLGTEQLDPREALLLGAVTGDGWVNPTMGVGFGFQVSVLDAWQTELLPYARDRFWSREKPHLKNEGRFYQLEWRTIASREWAQRLNKQHVPASVWTAQPAAIGAYLRGLFTTDGSISVGGVLFYQTSPTLIREVMLLLRMLGISSQYCVEQREHPHRDLYKIMIGRGRSLTRFRDVAGFADDRRQRVLEELLKRPERNLPERIKDVRLAGEADVYDISVPYGESFYADGLLVHNCKNWENQDLARQHWADCEKQQLAQAKVVRLTDPRGKNSPKYLAIRRAITDGRSAVMSGKFGVCLAGGVQSDFVESAYLCEKWSGRTGASVARAGAGPDPLPDELKDKIGD